MHLSGSQCARASFLSWTCVGGLQQSSLCPQAGASPSVSRSHGRMRVEAQGLLRASFEGSTRLLGTSFAFCAERRRREARTCGLLPKRKNLFFASGGFDTSPQGPFTRSAPRPSHAAGAPSACCSAPSARLAFALRALRCSPRTNRQPLASSLSARPDDQHALAPQAAGECARGLPPPCSVSAPQLRSASPAAPLLSARPLRAQRPPLNCTAPSRPPPHCSAPVPPLLSARPWRPSQAAKGPTKQAHKPWRRRGRWRSVSLEEAGWRWRNVSLEEAGEVAEKGLGEGGGGGRERGEGRST
jgi:hypothetical protein